MADDLWVGLRCVWKHRPRGGYGFVIRAPVTIRRLHATRATVEVEGTGKMAKVSRASLFSPPTMTGVGITAEIDPGTVGAAK
jgi:hypothetical protein